MKQNSILRWKSFHKWAGLLTTVFLLLFCVSGIILNHRHGLSDINISRSLLPGSYRISHYNNGAIRGTLPISSDSVLAYGAVGVWLTDRDFGTTADFNAGLPEGMDGRNIRNMIMTPDGDIWCAAQFGIFRRGTSHDKWIEVGLPENSERISDITLNADSSRIVVLTRSEIYTIPTRNSEAVPTRRLLQAPAGHSNKVSLFKSFWQLHSGELFGIAGRIVVDIIAGVIIFLCITGIVIFIMPGIIKRRSAYSPRRPRNIRTLRWNNIWHNRIGFYTIILTIIIAFTGMCLRPPLMIPLVMVKTAPLPYSSLDPDNPWHDKLRAIRWDEPSRKWIVSTSEGFVSVGEDLSGAPSPIEGITPPVSPMGITVFSRHSPAQWIVGSFSGIYLWDPAKGEVKNYLTGEDYTGRKPGRPVGDAAVSGYSTDLNTPSAVVFDYTSGAHGLKESELISRQPMSLWNAALELHVGRCYTPFLGPFSELFVFLAGLLLVLILVSGLIVHNRNKKHHNIKH